MLDLNGSIKLGDDIYVFPNFIYKEECLNIVNSIELIPEELWVGKFNEGGQGYEIAYTPVAQIEEINNRLISILDDGVNLGWSLAPTRMKMGHIGPHHSDNFDFLKTLDASKNLKDNEDFDMAENNIAGIIMYFNDFEGGELHYSNQNISYKPKAGDLLIHSSQEHCKHQVQMVESKVRYSHSSHLFNMIRVPKGYMLKEPDYV